MRSPRFSNASPTTRCLNASTPPHIVRLLTRDARQGSEDAAPRHRRRARRARRDSRTLERRLAGTRVPSASCPRASRLVRARACGRRRRRARRHVAAHEAGRWPLRSCSTRRFRRASRRRSRSSRSRRTADYLAVAPTFEGRAPIWLRPIDSSAGRILPGTEGATFPFWSPDGKSIGFFAERKLKRIEIDGEAVSIVTDAPIARGGMWQPDGTILFAPTPGRPAVPRAGLRRNRRRRDARSSPARTITARRFSCPTAVTFCITRAARRRCAASTSRGSTDPNRGGSPTPMPPRSTASGHLLFVRQGELLAQPFDADRLTLGGAAFRVAGPVAVNPGDQPGVAGGVAGRRHRVRGQQHPERAVRLGRSNGQRKLEALGQPEQTADGDAVALAGRTADRLQPGRRQQLGHLVDGPARNDEPASRRIPLWTSARSGRPTAGRSSFNRRECKGRRRTSTSAPSPTARPKSCC